MAVTVSFDESRPAGAVDRSSTSVGASTRGRSGVRHGRTVIELGDRLVAKIWRRRQERELETLRALYDAVAQAAWSGTRPFDAAIAASVYDMYGPGAAESEAILDRVILDRAIAERFGHDPGRLALYRAAYALTRSTASAPQAPTDTSSGACGC